jgi:peptidoglycan/LPS O-acetylase OafA/YrhL
MRPFHYSLGPGQFRVILAILVVFSHMSDFEIGRPAVFVFFMLSGYWVLRMYEQKYRPTAPAWVFYLSRFMRIWLAFATAFLATFLILALTPLAKPTEMLWGLPLLGIATTKRDVLGTSWSLDIELQFYLLVPVISLVLVWMGQSLSRLMVLAMGVAGLTILGWGLQLSFGLWTLMSYLPAFIIGVSVRSDCGYRAFQGRSSAIRLSLWSAMRARVSASQACGSTPLSLAVSIRV